MKRTARLDGATVHLNITSCRWVGQQKKNNNSLLVMNTRIARIACLLRAQRLAEWFHCGIFGVLVLECERQKWIDVDKSR